MLDSKAVADKHGVRLVAYEGGQHLVGIYEDQNNDQLTTLLTNTNRSPRMEGLYDEMFRLWSAVGGGTFSVYSYVGSYSKFGSWGILETQNQNTSAPKYKSADRWAEYYSDSSPRVIPWPE